MKKQVIGMFFVLLLSNICKGMVNPFDRTVLYFLKNGEEPFRSKLKMHLPSEKTITEHLNTHQFGNLEQESALKKTLSQKLGGKHTSERAIKCCTEYTIEDDPTYKTLPTDEKVALLEKITDAIVSLNVPSSSSSSSSSSS